MNFSSIFAPQLEAFVSQKQALGYDYSAQVRMLRNFDRMIQEHPEIREPVLTGDVVGLWSTPHLGESPRNQLCRISVIRQFGVYLNQKGQNAYLCPYPHQKDIQDYQPYIFSHDEIVRIFRVADSMKYRQASPLAHVTTPMVLRILYGTGMRISEVLNLRRKDVDLDAGTIFVLQSKGFKDRLIPMSASLLQAFHSYFEKVECEGNEDIVFPSRTGALLHKNTFYTRFRNILWRAGISHRGRGKGPRVHDLRHTFAVHCLNRWAAEKKDITLLLPVLAVYLGHEHLRMTTHYLRLTAEVYPELVSRFEAHFGDVVPAAFPGEGAQYE
jgi:integrase